MAKDNNKDVKRYNCINFGACAKADSKEIIEIDSLETIGGIPACPYCHQHTLQELVKKPVNKTLIIGIIAAVVIIGGILAAVFAGGGKTEAGIDPEISVVDSDSIRAAQQEKQQRLQNMQDSLQAVADSLAAEQARQDSIEHVRPESITKIQSQPAAKPTAPRATSGTKNLGYATFKGSWPNDVNGRMVFNTSHVIDSKDPKGRVAEAGDYVIGEWVDGHLVQGIWYGADNEVKGSVIIGR